VYILCAGKKEKERQASFSPREIHIRREIMAKWKLSSSHSCAELTVRHMMVTWVHGQFNKITGMAYFDPLNVAASAV
jgi:polyisoprenoid-binding protein YceI